MFASRSLTEHIARGLVGLSCVVATVVYSTTLPWLAFVLLPLALLSFRGCPMCWTIGLAETVSARLRGKRKADGCVDGSCARSRT